MRLVNQTEPKVKLKVAEDYSFVEKIIKESKFLPILVYVYTGLIVVMAALQFIDGGYVLAGIDVVIHALICVSLWLFIGSWKKHNDGEAIPTKGLKMFQITHAVKYFLVFVFFVVLIVLTILSWISHGNEAHKLLVEAKQQTDAEILAAAKANSTKVFWEYLFTMIGVLAVSIVTCVYYRAVMVVGDSYLKYADKGTHFLKEIKFLMIYSFVSAGILVVYSVLAVAGIIPNAMGLIISSNFNMVIGGVGIFSLIARVLFAIFLVGVGLLCMKLLKELKDVDTTVIVVIDNETGETLRVATPEDIEEDRKYQEELTAALKEEEEEQGNFVSEDLLRDEK